MHRAPSMRVFAKLPSPPIITDGDCNHYLYLDTLVFLAFGIRRMPATLQRRLQGNACHEQTGSQEKWHQHRQR